MKFFITISLLFCLLAPITWAAARSSQPVQSRDSFRSIRTNNLFIVGNAAEEDLRQAAIWLEFFHSSFAQLVSRNVVDSSIPTTVIIFKDDASFVPFKPLYQGRPADVAGYFQPGHDMNYIVMSLERIGRDPLSTAFHEYVHLHLQNNFPGVPLWLNEGLAEFYGAIVSPGGEAMLGAPLPYYTRLLRSQGAVPLTSLFSVNQSSPDYNEQDKSGLFYAQSWALVHYLMMGDSGRRQQQFKRFLSLASQGESMEKAFDNAFGVGLEAVERGFGDYIRSGDWPSQRLNLGTSGPRSHIAMQRTSVTEGEANFYLGDLLLHIHREDTAEKYFKQAIALDPSFIPTYASLGMLRVRQNRLVEAKKYLERAVTMPQNYLVHYSYAYILSREGLTAEGTIREYSPENSQLMRDQLSKAIKASPEFPDSYYLLAFVELASKEQKLDQALSLVQRAQKLAPSRLGYSLLVAQIYNRMGQKESAQRVLEPLARQSADKDVRDDAQQLLEELEGNGTSTTRRRALAIAAPRELEKPRTQTGGTMIGGSSTGVSIRDGNTVDSSGPMPSVDKIISDFVEAVGGPEVLASATTRIATGTIDVVGVSRGGSVEIYANNARKSLTVVRAQPLGEVKIGFNGTLGWMYMGRGGSSANGAEMSGLQWVASLWNPAGLKTHYSSVKLVGKSKIGFREVFLLELQPTKGASQKLYLDANTHLPVRVNSAASEIYLDDWRVVDGVKMPFSITQSSPGMTLKISLKEIKQNVALNDSIFERPLR